MAPELVGYITIPLYEMGDREYTSFRQSMLTAGPHSVSSGAGLGSDAVYAEINSEDDKNKT